MWVIATEGGYLDTPVRIGGDDHETDFLLMMPGERYTVIVDFNGYAPGARDENEEDDLDPNGEIYSGTYILRNTANVPYPDGDPIDKGTTDRIMEFRVTKTATKDTSFNPAKKNAVLRGEGAKGAAIVRLAEPTTGSLVAKQHKVRQLTLNEVMGMEREAIEPSTGERAKFPGGPLEVLVNNTEWTGMRTRSATDEEIEREYRADFSLDAKNLNSLSELPYEGETEIWSFINLTADAHPIHLHLVQFQLLNRQDFDVDRYDEDYEAAFPGGGHNHMTGLPYAKGEFMPGFGPPLDYNTGTDGILGGNIDVTRIGEDGRAVYLRGDVQPPKAYEAGWKDTITCYPGQVTRIVVRFTPVEFPLQDEPYTTAFPFNPGQGYSYVWHCHIIDHEDNEMMRPFEVQPLQATRSLVRGRDY
jgi:FtsP/CotA-like multicopper oxidase with cupredoxin domain